MGSNMAECHPVGFRWVMEARRRGAKIIHVDPRFTRTSAMASAHVPIRAGSDIAFLGGLIRYVIESGRWFDEYVKAFTNAATLIEGDFRDTDDLDGLFSGWKTDEGKYDISSWQYEGVKGVVPAAGHKEVFDEPGAGKGETEQSHFAGMRTDPTLQDPRCVFQIVRRHFARYTPELVEEICGTPKELFLQVAEALCANSGRERTSAFCYAVGWTQHSVGVQYIRAASILQLLLGNIGRPGGGILALRGHASIQGSTDIPTLYDLLPGYLPMPTARHGRSLEEYVRGNRAQSGWWSEFPKYVVSLLKAWYGDAARKENDFGFAWLPKLTGDHSHLVTVADMAEGRVKGYFVMGQNPVVGSPHGSLQRKGLRNAEWVVVRDLALNETATFWHEGPEFESGELRPEDVGTEVFFFPAAAHTEKDGSFTNTQRLLQWREKAVDPPGDARSELWFVYHLGRRLKELYAGSELQRDEGFRALTWSHSTNGPYEEPDAEEVLAEVNGYRVADRSPVAGFTELESDGSTAAGCWLYTGVYAGGVNQANRRKPAGEQSWVAQEWGWAWPSDRRLLYNRASADLEGRPWSERKRYVWWDENRRKWAGHDTPDFLADRPPDYRPAKDAQGLDTIGGDAAFIMQPDGRGWLFAPSGLLDGPLPTHYEAQESPIRNPLYGQQCNPARGVFRRRDNPYHRAWADPRYPHVLTTFRLTEHHTAGTMSRWLSWLVELQPELFCEVSPELAREVGLRNGGWATVRTARGAVDCRVLVTRRVAALRVGGRTLHQVGLPYHWGYVGRVHGDIANDLLSFVADPNVHIMESKALTCSIEPGRSRDHRRSATTRLAPPLAEAKPARRDLPGVGQHGDQPLQEPGGGPPHGS